jgi:hypothetical protein
MSDVDRRSQSSSGGASGASYDEDDDEDDRGAGSGGAMMSLFASYYGIQGILAVTVSAYQLYIGLHILEIRRRSYVAD